MKAKRFIGLVVTMLLFGFMASVLWAEGEAPAAATYVGAKKCKMCHNTQHGQWLETGHSHAFAALIGAEATNPECLKCHTTGFGVGGYDLAAEADARAAFENVQCEMCHGPGSNHVSAPREQKKTTINRNGANCFQCHDPHRSRKKEALDARAAAAAAAAAPAQ